MSVRWGCRGVRAGGERRFVSLFVLSLLLSYSKRGGSSTRARAIDGGTVIEVRAISTRSIRRVDRFATAMRTGVSGGVTPRGPIHVRGLFTRINSRMGTNRLLIGVSRAGLGRAGVRLSGRRLRFGHVSRLCGMNNTSGST